MKKLDIVLMGACLAGVGVQAVLGVPIPVVVAEGVGCLLIDWKDVAIRIGKTHCGFLRNRIYQTCKVASL